MKPQHQFMDDRMSLLEAGLDYDDTGTLSLRWEANKLVLEIWKLTTGRTLQEIDDELYLVRSKFRDPIMSDSDAYELVKSIKLWVNSITSLGHTQYHHALQLYLNERWAIAGWLWEEQFDIIPVAIKYKLHSEISNMLWSQTTRGIGGAEAKASVTRIQETTGKHQSTEEITMPKKKVNFLGLGKDGSGGME